MLFPRAAVIGIGLIGGSFALAAKRAGLVGQVIGVARSEATREGALEKGAADAVTADPHAAVANADLVYLATPVDSICALLTNLGPSLKPGALITDAGSTKVQIMAAAANLPAEVTFIGGHPLAGSEQAGIAAARADLFEGCNYLLTPRTDTSEAAVERMQELVQALPARPVVVTPELHDHMLAMTSHLPHLLAWALCTAAGQVESPEALAPFTAGAWRDTTRIADSPEEVWADILLSNAENLAAAAGEFTSGLQALLQAIERGDRRALLKLLRQARETHQRMRKP